MATVVQLVVEGLRRAGVPRLFGVPGGGSSLDLIEAAREQGLPFVACRAESAAVIMAAVTGELTGQPGAALAALGPGVTASATGLAHAQLDRSPLLYVSERYPDDVLAFAARQVIDHAAHVAPLVKASVALTAASAAARVAEAARLACAEPRGPVHLELAADVSRQPGRRADEAAAPSAAAPPDADRLDQAAAMIRAARRPVVIAGLECRLSDAKWLRAFAEALPAPVLTTYKAKGAIPDPHPLALGAFTGGVLEEPVVGRADLIIGFGLDPVELIPRRWPYAAPVLSLRRAPSSETPRGGRHVTPALEVVGDLAGMLEDLAPRLMGNDARADWDVAEVDRLRRERIASLDVPADGLAPQRVVQRVRERLPAGAIAAIDRGAHELVATACWQAVEPGECLISNGLAAAGFALPAAIAARLVHPDRPVVCFTDAAGVLAAVAELETAARLALPIAVVAFDGGGMSPIEAEPVHEADGGAASQRARVDLPALARAFGIAAFSASDEAALERALGAAEGVRGPALIAARVDPSAFRRMLEIAGGAPETGAVADRFNPRV